MTENEATQTMSFATKFLSVINVVFGSWVGWSVFTSYFGLRELFRGMNLQLPLITRVTLLPGFRLIIPGLVLCAVGAFLALRKTPEICAKFQAVTLVGIVCSWFFSLCAALLPLYQLIGNLG